MAEGATGWVAPSIFLDGNAVKKGIECKPRSRYAIIRTMMDNSNYTMNMGTVTFPHLPPAPRGGQIPVPADTEPQPYETYRNTFNYTLWVEGTRVRLYSVDWDGERDAPYWETADARDAWFDAQTPVGGVTLETTARADHGTVRIPVPYDVCATANYMRVTMPAYPVANESDTGLRDWYYYIEDINYLSPSATEITLTPDWWTTCVGRVTVRRVRLAQGHWAVDNSATPSEYCESPMNHTTNLMDNEGDYSPLTVMRMLFADQFNKNATGLYAVVDFGAANPYGDYTSGVPAAGATSTGGLMGGSMVATPAENLITLLDGIPDGLILCAKAVWIVPSKFLTLGMSHTLGGVTVYELVGGAVVTNTIDVTPDSWDYPDWAAGYTKLYTSQYSQFEIVTDDGTVINVRPESIGTKGVTYEEVSQICDDALRITGWLCGIGDNDKPTQTIAQIGTIQEFIADLGWHTTQTTWDCPCYAVHVTNERAQNWLKATERSQAYRNADVARDNAYDTDYTAYYNSVDTSGTSNANAVAGANTAHENAYTNADAAYTIAGRNAALGRTNTARNNQATTEITEANNLLSTNVKNATVLINDNLTHAAMIRQMESNGIVSDDPTNDPYGLASAGTLMQTSIDSTGGASHPYWRGSNLWKLLMDSYSDVTYQEAVTQTNVTADINGLTAGVITNVASSAANVAAAGFIAGGVTTGIAGAATGAIVGAMVGTVSAQISASNITGKSADLITQYTRNIIGLNTSTAQNLESFSDFHVNDFGSDWHNTYALPYGKLSVTMWNAIVQDYWARQTANVENAQRNALSDSLTTYRITNANSVNTAQTNSSTDIAENNASNTEANALTTRTASYITADATQQTSIANTGRVYTTATDNAYRTLDTQLGNVRNTVGYNGSVAHADHTGTVNRTWTNAQKAIEAGIEADNRGIPRTLSVSDTGTWGSRTQGVLIRSVRPDDGTLHRIVDRFARYGYRCDRIVETPNLGEMGDRGYSYWRVNEIWLEPTGLVPMRALDSIKSMFVGGIILKQETSKS